MAYVTTADGIRAYYEQSDEQSGKPALIMLHGASQDTLSWQYNLAFFASDYTVYALDLPGHGKSGMSADGPHKRSEDNARYLLQVMDALGLTSATLMGHSMGGGVVASVAALAPPRVTALVLVDGASVNVVKSSGYNSKILEMARVNTGDWFEVTFRTPMGTATDVARADEIVTDARRCIPAVAFADISAFGSFRMENILDAITCPVVIVEGAEDWSVPPESARKVETALRARGVPVEYIEWLGVGHFPQSECPDLFNQDTLAAMKRLRPQ